VAEGLTTAAPEKTTVAGTPASARTLVPEGTGVAMGLAPRSGESASAGAGSAGEVQGCVPAIGEVKLVAIGRAWLVIPAAPAARRRVCHESSVEIPEPGSATGRWVVCGTGSGTGAAATGRDASVNGKAGDETTVATSAAGSLLRAAATTEDSSGGALWPRNPIDSAATLPVWADTGAPGLSCSPRGPGRGGAGAGVPAAATSAESWAPAASRAGCPPSVRVIVGGVSSSAPGAGGASGGAGAPAAAGSSAASPVWVDFRGAAGIPGVGSSDDPAGNGSARTRAARLPAPAAGVPKSVLLVPTGSVGAARPVGHAGFREAGGRRSAPDAAASAPSVGAG